MQKPSIESARKFLECPDHQVELPEHEPLCKECENGTDPGCLRCRVEILMAAYAASLEN
jgi:hypothetical protein